MGLNRYIIGIIVFTTLLCARPAEPAAVEPAQVKAALIIQFIRFVSWPSQPAKVRIGILSDDTELFNNLRQLVNQSRSERNFTVVNLSETFSAEDIDLLYLGPNYSQRLDEFADITRRSETLLVSDESPFTRDIMLNLIKVEDRIRFEVNRSNIVFESLQVDKEILLLGGSELDVAQLFRETEDGLKSLKQQLLTQEESLAGLSDKILAMESELADTETQLSQRNTQVRDLNSSLNAVQETLDSKNRELSDRNAALEKAQNQLDRVRDALTRSSQQLASNQAETADLARTIDARNKVLTDLQTAIQTQQETLTNQEATLGQQSDRIQQQQSYLLLAAFTLLVFIGLSAQIIRISNKRNRLNQDLREANEALAVAKQSADAANRAKGDFVAKMSHEIRTPLNAILGFTEILVMDNAATEQQKKQLDTINRNGQHLLSMIEDVLDISSIESGASDLHPVVFSLPDLVEDITQIFELQLEQSNLSLSVQIDEPHPIFIELDKQKLRQILINLIGNSIKFTSTGGITLKIGTSENNYLEIDIADTGTGIDEVQQNRVFERFEQSDSGLQLGTGTGLGLPISKEFAVLMGGDLSVTSKLGEGSTFHLRVPFQLAEQPQQNAKQEIQLNAQGQRILVIDDIQSNLDLLVSILEPFGLNVDTADTGQAGLDLINRNTYQLVLLDLKLPDIMGDVILQRIRQEPKTSELKVVIVTANDLLGEREKLLRLGANDFISKPFTRTQILSCLDNLLEEATMDEKPPEANETEQHQAAQPNDNNRRLLVVDDNADIRTLITRIAEQLNFEVTTAEDGQAGLEAWNEIKPSVVVTDCNMPRLTGIEMARRIKHEANKASVHTTILGVTGLVTDTQACLDAGMDDVVTKPFRMAQLKETFIKNGLA